MILEFIGADHEVTGSCHYIEVAEKKLLIDYGMEQGFNKFENVDLPVPPSSIDYVIITHAHIDHTGDLPLLYARGFRGRIITTKATADLCNIMLKDTAHIQESEAEWRNRKGERAGKEKVEPRYTMKDALGTLELIEGADYLEKIRLCDNITIRFIDVGHLLGSASVELWLSEGDVKKKIVFSGDIGNKNKALIRDPQYVDDGDYVVMESTYGDRLHKPNVDHTEELRRIIQETLDRGGNVVIPAFAVGRTQELLYYIRDLKEKQLIKGHDGFEVYVDSPLAVEATQIFKKNIIDCFDDETQQLIRRGINPLGFEGLKIAVSAEESKNINFIQTPKVIISAAGMCDAGRIRHHLKHNLWRPESSVVFAGYQSVGTLGRILQDGTKNVKLFGETIEVKAHIETMEGISGHADRDGLVTWITSFKKQTPSKVFVVHGDDEVCDSFCELLKTDHGLNAQAPFSGSVYDLANDAWIKQTEGILIVRETVTKQTLNNVYVRLSSAGERLLKVIEQNRSGANKDLAKFADQIDALCDKWSR